MRACSRCVVVLVLTASLATVRCGRSSDGPKPPASAQQPPVTQPQVLQQVDPDFSETTGQFLATSSTKIMIVLHIAVKKDGSAGAVKVVRAEPADLPVARAFAEEVAATIPKWRFRPATVGGKPVDAEFDFVMEAQGEGQADEAAK